MRCEFCGEEFEEGKYCPFCGKFYDKLPEGTDINNIIPLHIKLQKTEKPDWSSPLPENSKAFLVGELTPSKSKKKRDHPVF